MPSAPSVAGSRGRAASPWTREHLAGKKRVPAKGGGSGRDPSKKGWSTNLREAQGHEPLCIASTHEQERRFFGLPNRSQCSHGVSDTVDGLLVHSRDDVAGANTFLGSRATRGDVGDDDAVDVARQAERRALAIGERAQRQTQRRLALARTCARTGRSDRLVRGLAEARRRWV